MLPILLNIIGNLMFVSSFADGYHLDGHHLDRDVVPEQTDLHSGLCTLDL